MIHNQEGVIIAVISKTKGLYHIASAVEAELCVATSVHLTTILTVMELHCCIGHIALDAICQLIQEGHISSI